MSNLNRVERRRSESRVQLLISQERNRAAVRHLLEDRYEVLTDESVVEADAYLVDDFSFPDYHAALEERVEASNPAFCPVVLVRRERTNPRIVLPDPEENDDSLLVDEIVTAPIECEPLVRQLNSLLARRQQSLELMHSVTRLEESNRALEQFAYAASHDLQEPLRMVSSYLQLIERRYGDDLDEDGEEFLEYAVDGAERMHRMIKALLEYSRVDTESGSFEPVDLETVVENVRSDLRMKIGESQAEVSVDPLPMVRGDAEQLRQLFQNLLSNALEYTDEESPTIRIAAEADGERCQVSVTDDGLGISPENQDRIFDVFERLHTRDEHPGTGIGLALCKRIVDRHDGRIWVESEPGEGSTFTFTLPLADESAESEAASKSETAD
ncbi:sensor histidine kinase [Natronosalvus rutilus]|uniref:histidine kinase n=1 Tax=Natronosalvus rutilus TaxID=2953753 RepID=A0A9E7SXD5_9EURY|nr:ATP-binding protein [Natronosalvus rutilus]UTF54028.1 ATP-binding protein [Natronosalvus rutilus]